MQTAQSQPITGTPVEVPVPRKVISITISPVFAGCTRGCLVRKGKVPAFDRLIVLVCAIDRHLGTPCSAAACRRKGTTGTRSGLQGTVIGSSYLSGGRHSVLTAGRTPQQRLACTHSGDVIHRRRSASLPSARDDDTGGNGTWRLHVRTRAFPRGQDTWDDGQPILAGEIDANAPSASLVIQQGVSYTLAHRAAALTAPETGHHEAELLPLCRYGPAGLSDHD